MRLISNYLTQKKTIFAFAYQGCVDVGEGRGLRLSIHDRLAEKATT